MCCFMDGCFRRRYSIIQEHGEARKSGSLEIIAKLDVAAGAYIFHTRDGLKIVPSARTAPPLGIFFSFKFEHTASSLRLRTFFFSALRGMVPEV
jgi:peroxiredoxin family protein